MPSARPLFTPRFTITAKVARALMRVEGAKQAITDLPITPAVIATLRETGFSERTARALLADWVEHGFVVVADPAKKSRKYSLAPKFRRAILT